MHLDGDKALVLDRELAAYAEELRAAGDANAVATLGYTHGIHRIWRQVLGMLPVPEDSAILDVGTGFALLPFELAANADLELAGIDLEPSFVRHSHVLRDRLAAAGFLRAGSEVDLRLGDACDLPYADGAFDLVFVREVLQFIPDPVAALVEVRRVLRPGGFACVGDTDDGLRITWPPPSPALSRLVDAVSAVQHEHGGDRQSGRKLTTHLRGAGFAINSIVVLPEAQHRLVRTDDRERALILDQLEAVRPTVTGAGTVDARQFDADLAAFAAAEPFEEFRLNARIVVLAQRPGD
ncbi:MAG TPA: methyltransferase domain-containing protein [Solirubrobacteraceae bacterium]|nr:methyltransferase domain-containing protein [Solirubrobacteraceae bacterium]